MILLHIITHFYFKRGRFMEKKSFADKIAEKSFNSPKFQKSWQVHMNAFGPILEPAFKDNYTARVHLTAALNEISSGKLKQGHEKLSKLGDACVTNDDKAAWLFFMGLCFKMAGKTGAMFQYYDMAEKIGHKFYLPYLEMAKAAHSEGVFDDAYEYYFKAMQCIDASENEKFFVSPPKNSLLASVGTNFASCLTMMHRYDAAEAELERAEELLPTQPGRSATKAILYAAMGREDDVAACLEALKTEAPVMLAQTQKMTDEILAGKHAHFAAIEPAEGEIEAFWAWFCENEEKLLNLLASKETDEFFELIQPALAKPFPFMNREPELCIGQEEGKTSVSLADFYTVSLSEGYKKLIDACPEEIKARWSFEIVH